MTTINQLLAKNLPERNLSQLSLVNASKNEMIKWVNALPVMNVGETTKQLYQTLQELTHVKMSEDLRFELLEILRPTVYNILHALAKHYLNQAILLPERANRVAALAQSLRTHLALAYKVTAYDSAERLMTKLSIIGVNRRQHLQLAAQSFTRAITELNGLLLERQQLYLSAPAHLWSDLHLLHHVATAHGVANTVVSDNHLVFRKESSAHDAYLRAIIVAGSQNNKLRQTEIKQIFDTSELWTTYLKLKPKFQPTDLLLIDIHSDAPPCYVSKSADVLQAHYVDATKLVQRLQTIQTTPQNQLPLGEQLNQNLIQHLTASWSNPSERIFPRRSYDGKLLICLGITAAHYQLCNEMEFEHYLNLPPDFSEEERNFFANNNNASVDPHDILDFKISSVTSIANEKNIRVQHHKNQTGLYPPYAAKIINISPGGYCVLWDCEPPLSLRTGEILAMRESTEKDWTIGIIRWVKQLPTQGAEAGIEIIAGSARPCGARVLKKTGERTEYMRTFLIPEFASIKRPITLLTPNVSFKTGYNIMLRQGNEEYKAQLTSEFASTQSFSQFTFTQLQIPISRKVATSIMPDSTNTQDDFDTLWGNL